jgi:hypothetical protein
LLRDSDRRQRVIFWLFAWRSTFARPASSWASRSFFADNPLAKTASFLLEILALFPKVFVTQAVFCILKSALFRNIIITSSLNIIFAVIASLLFVIILIACIISCDIRFRSEGSVPGLRITSSLTRRAETTILGYYASLLLIAGAATAAQLYTKSG